MDRPIQRTVIIVGACQKIHSPPIKCSVTDFFTGEEKDDDEQIVVRVKLYLHFSFNSITFFYFAKFRSRMLQPFF